ncbi:amidase [Starkeya sp. ORNL1]|jgi:Asp-tRNA(Asn)/Glu-tRNA(Gln) amidotransferase A subunit family amidase|uniref:amidase n=1 Tax=Starkeya sp. ORNL1 TaxID=2709380 RepID=UPI001462A687|nr:amidase [Starkeya sp. ORNL1]QJP12214.1 amidase [Starkeya sp. ORNL1]
MTEMLSALALAEAVRSGRLSPADIADRCADTIAAREAEIGAFAAIDLDALRQAARAPGLADGRLAGLPVGVKDIIDTADFPTARGSAIYDGHRPASDAAIVRMLAHAGGLIAGKTATTEFAFMNPALTRNPHHAGHTPGGSSAGSAAAVAAGMLPLAIGTQTGGSVIRPASFCGVAGYKASYKLLPTIGVKAFSWSLDTLGLFAARVADLAFAAGAITGRDFDLRDAGQPPRLAFVITARAEQATADAHAALDEAARAAERRGARVLGQILPPEVEAADAAHNIIQSYEVALALADEYDRHRERLSPVLRDYLDAARGVSPEHYDEARRTARRARHAAADAFANFDAVLTFSATGEAPEGLGSTGSPVFNRLWTLLGAPCVNVAGLRGAKGLPVGVQVVGRFGRDKATLNIARFLERAIAAE